MRKKRPIGPKDFMLEVIGEKTTIKRTYRLLRVSILKKSATIRRRVIVKMLNNSDAIGLIELFKKGGIIHEPKWRFYGLLILKNACIHEKGELKYYCEVCGKEIDSALSTPNTLLNKTN